MFNLKIKNPLESESKFDSNYTKLSLSNSLDVNNCLFTPELLNILLRSYKDESNYLEDSSNNYRKMDKNIEGVYFIAFRVLNKKEKTLIYNYIYYNDLLYLTLIVYFLVRNYFIVESNHEWSKYLVIIDNRFLYYNNVGKHIYIYNTKEKVKHKY